MFSNLSGSSEISVTKNLQIGLLREILTFSSLLGTATGYRCQTLSSLEFFLYKLSSYQ